jgi:serine/threonine protein kinase
MGFVLAATHVHLQERVAIKMLIPSAATATEVVERFLREGRAAVRIRSEHVVRILDVAELPDPTNDSASAPPKPAARVAVTVTVPVAPPESGISARSTAIANAPFAGALLPSGCDDGPIGASPVW